VKHRSTDRPEQPRPEQPRTEQPRPEQPRSEPEIIPPDRAGSRAFHRRSAAHRAAPREAFEAHRYERVYVAPPRPFSIILAVLALVAVAAALVVFLLGTFLIALPLIGSIVLVAFITAFIRGNRREMR